MVAPIPTDNTFDFPLEVNCHGYALCHHSGILVLQNLATGQFDSIAATLYDRYGISHFVIYPNLQASPTSYLESDTCVAYDLGTVRATDPWNLMSDASLSILQDPYNSSRKTTVLNTAFSEKVGTANTVIRTSNERSGVVTITVIDALRVASTADPEPVDRVPSAEPEEPEPTSDSGAGTVAVTRRRLWWWW